MRRADPVLVFDLDGTVLHINSFPVWVMFLALGGARQLTLRQQMSVAVLVIRLLAWRKIGRIDHATLLREMQGLWHFATAGDNGAAAQRLAALLLRATRRNVLPALKLITDGALDGVFATAAAEDYAVALGHRLGVASVLATRSERTADEPDNSGANKRDRLFAWLASRDWTGRPLIFFNDHLADLPLMRECSIVCWFGSRHALEQAKREAANVRFVDCRRLTAREMHATIAHLCQSVTIARIQNYAIDPRASTLA